MAMRGFGIHDLRATGHRYKNAAATQVLRSDPPTTLSTAEGTPADGRICHAGNRTGLAEKEKR